MKLILASRELTIPEGVSVEVKGRRVRVKGPRGELQREFKHLQLQMEMLNPKTLRVEVWFAKRKQLACVRTVVSHVQNMITGVVRGYKYTMKSAYAHFPINMNIAADKKSIQVRNFLGEKLIRTPALYDGVQVEATGNKDEIMVYGNDIEKVSCSAARIQQSTSVKKKDIRKFLDGVYVSNKGHIEAGTEED